MWFLDNAWLIPVIPTVSFFLILLFGKRTARWTNGGSYIGLAYRWLTENRNLVAMALPQLAVDAKQMPHLRLLVDQADLNAEVLQPIFQVNTVTICSLTISAR